MSRVWASICLIALVATPIVDLVARADALADSIAEQSSPGVIDPIIADAPVDLGRVDADIPLLDLPTTGILPEPPRPRFATPRVIHRRWSGDARRRLVDLQTFRC